MAKLIDHIASISGADHLTRLDMALVEAVLDVFTARRAAIFSVLPSSGEARWLERVYAQAGQPVVQVDPLWLDHDNLPLLGQAASRMQCLQRRELIEVAAGPGQPVALTLLPLFSDAQLEAVIELQQAVPAGAAVRQAWASLQRTYRNTHARLDAGERDGLTGLLNRRAFEQTFGRAASGVPAADDGSVMPALAAVQVERRKQVSGQRFWLALVNLDHFGQINEARGHLTGDQCLVQVARLLGVSLRSCDRVYRLGGAEFVVLLRCPDDRGAFAALDRFRMRLADSPLDAGLQTISAGFTALSPADTPGSALARADEALFAAKAQGRNRICDHGALQQSC